MQLYNVVGQQFGVIWEYEYINMLLFSLTNVTLKTEINVKT